MALKYWNVVAMKNWIFIFLSNIIWCVTRCTHMSLIQTNMCFIEFNRKCHLKFKIWFTKYHREFHSRKFSWKIFKAFLFLIKFQFVSKMLVFKLVKKITRVPLRWSIWLLGDLVNIFSKLTFFHFFFIY